VNSLNFSKIRNHDGSQDNGFEELVCQLAHLSRPDNAKYFVRKDGAGGDAGVECYWKLYDDSEHAWQAKYFLGSLDSSQWTQISKSVETALNKHPKLTKYYVCLPRDWNDSRKTGSGGKTVNSAWDKWLEYVDKWKVFANNLDMKVEFTYWCKHEMSMLLQRDSPEFSGRSHYWFNTPVLTTDTFCKLTERSMYSLGERYTPEFHLDLPIANDFEALGKTDRWWKELENHINDWRKAASDANDAILLAAEESPGSILTSINSDIDGLSKNLVNDLINKYFIHNIHQYITFLKSLLPGLSEAGSILSQKSDNDKVNETLRYQRSNCYKFESETLDFVRYLNSSAIKAATKRSILLVGDAGRKISLAL